MKVYLVTLWGTHEFIDVLGVFSTREKAENVKNPDPKFYFIEIDECEVDRHYVAMLL